MAKANIRFGEIYNEENNESIVLSAYNSVGFRREVNRQLKNGFGRSRANLAQGYVSEAIQTIKNKLNTGLNQSGAIDGDGFHLGGVSYSYSFVDHTIATKRAKKNRIGAGKFWLDWGKPNKRGVEPLRAAMSSIRPPKVRYSTEVVGVDRRRGPDRIDFEMTIGLSEMDYPLDEMVRRPLITGEATDAISGDYSGAKLDVLAILEYGAYGSGLYGVDIPERPWISGFAAEVGNVMFDDLITNR